MPAQARCYYEILGLPRDCTPEEIRSAYKRLALQLHPDKVVASGGVSEREATAAFQALLNAYQVLCDPRERAFYDSHRSQILAQANSSSSSSSSSSSPFGGHDISVSDLFPLFSNSAYSSFSDTGKGFYKVYAGVFDRIYAQELAFAKELKLGVDAVGQAPAMGNLESPYAQVSAFYSYWMGFVTVMDFKWADQYRASDGFTRKARRCMEEENKKARKRARKEYIETVRGLAEFVKKRDKRVIEMQMRRSLEEEKRRAEEKERKKEEARKRLERAQMYEEPEWARMDEVGEDDEEVVDDFFNAKDDGKKKEDKELYCVVCSKKFKSEKQWKNHEQSKKHREKVAELRDAYKAEHDEDDEDDDKDGVEESMGGNKDGRYMGVDHDLQPDDNVDELCEEFKVGVSMQKESTGFSSAKAEQKVQEEEANSFGSDEEDDFLEAMVSGHKNQEKESMWEPKLSPTSHSNGHGNADTGYNNNDHDNDDEVIPMEYDTLEVNWHSRLSNKEDRAESSPSSTDYLRVEVDEPNGEAMPNSSSMENQVDRGNGDGISPQPESSSHADVETAINSASDKSMKKNTKASKQSVDQKFQGQKKDTKSKHCSKGKKQKEMPKASGHACEICGEAFESRIESAVNTHKEKEKEKHESRGVAKHNWEDADFLLKQTFRQ
ncbi:hypothetical protein ACLOJK_035580 [Asimina triloba]